MGHPSAVIVPTVLAVGETYKISEADVLKAFIIGTEVSCRLGELTKPTLYENGWHATSVVGVLGAAAAAGYLLKLDVQQLENCFGIAATTAFGLRSGMAFEASVQDPRAYFSSITILLLSIKKTK
ncbi:2-methylcitrate dehydratase PrpD [Peribacillus cavernae]|nr:2-methylcitrate dehydratase PrpD [Peribacillus cavernae]